MTVRFQVDFMGNGRAVRPPKERKPRARRNAPAKPQAAPPSRVARLLVLAHHIEDLVASGRCPDSTTAGAALGLRQPRVQQILALLVLAPDLQERILAGAASWSEKQLQAAIATPLWDGQQMIIASTPGARRA